MRLPRPLFSFVVCVSLTALLPPAVLMVLPEGRISTPFWLLLLSTWGFAFLLTHSLAAPSVAPLRITFYVFGYLFLGLVPAAQFWIGDLPWGGGYSDPEVLRGVLVVWLGVIAYEVGRKLPRGIVAGPVKPGLDSSPSLLQSAVISALFLGIAFGFLEGIGGVSSLFIARDDLHNTVLERAGGEGLAIYQLVVTLVRIPVLVLSILALAVVLDRGHALKGLGWVVLTVVLVSANLVINNPVSTPRYLVGTYVIAYLWLIALRVSPHRSGAVVGLASLGAMIVLFPLADIFRISLEVTEDELLLSLERGIAASVRKPDFDAFQCLLNALRVVDNDGLQWGYQILASLLFWFPRALWPAKPDTSGVFVAEQMGYQTTNLSMPLWSEFYLDFGFPGLVAGMGAFGLISARLDFRFSVHAPYVISSLLVLLFSSYQIYFLRGALMTSVSYFAPTFLLLGLLNLLSRRRGPPLVPQKVPNRRLSPVAPSR